MYGRNDRNMKQNKTRKPLLPVYAYAPMAIVVAAGILTYFGTRLVTQGRTHSILALPIDGAIPFVPFFSILYVLAFAQWGAGIVLIAREEREICRRVMAGEIIAKLICMALFIILPTTMVRAEIPSNDVFSGIMKFIYKIDAPNNLFPSIHCMESWTCFCAARRMKRTGKGYLYFSLVFSLLVCASTVLVKQHVAVDIAAGILVAEIGQYIARKLSAERVFERIDGIFR